MTGDAAASFTKPCETWGCPHCGPIKARRSVAHYSTEFSALTDVRFVTLTLDPKCGLDEAKSRKYVIHAWSKWRKQIDRLCKKTGEKLAFVRVVEFHTSGYAHLHAVLSAPGVSDDELAARWFRVGGGVVVDVQSLGSDPKDVARRVGYCVKYAIKEATRPGVPRGRHQLEPSQGIGYKSEAAVARRLAIVNEKLNAMNENETDDSNELGPDEVRVYTVEGGAARPSDPDAITPEDVAEFDKLDMEARSTVYRTKRGGVWIEIRQHKDGTRTERELPGYRSLYEQRTGSDGQAPDYLDALHLRPPRDP